MEIASLSFSSPFARLSLFAGMLSFHLLVFAHEPGMSTAMVTVDKGSAQVVLTFSSAEVKAMTLPLETGTEGKIDKLADRIMILSGRAPSSARRDLSSDGDVVFHLDYTELPPGAITIEAPLLASFVPGHRQYLIVRDGRKHLLLRRFLTPDANIVTVDDSPE